MKSQKALARMRVEVLGNYVMNNCCKIIAASDGASLRGREGAFWLRNGKTSMAVLWFCFL